MLKSIKIKTRLPILFLVIGVIPLIVMLAFTYRQIKQAYVKDAVGGLMNFVDAKQQGVIRLIDQNKKLAIQLAHLAPNMPSDKLSEYFKHIVESDMFDMEKHPFKEEIKSGQRKIPTFGVYHFIDYVKDGKIIASSDASRIEKPWEEKADFKWGYFDPYYAEDRKLLFTFSKKGQDGTIYIHADGKILTDIVNGEIGNLPEGMGAFYLAGVGKTMDYYIVNRDNKMITESRTYPDAILKQAGSVVPWEKTVHGHTDPACAGGKYHTNAGVATGCREAMGFYPGQSGQRLLGASMPFYDSEWTIVVEQEEKEILGPMYQVRNQMILFTFLMGILIAAVSILVSRGISQPIHTVMESLKDIAVGEGDLTRRIAVSSKDEIGELSHWFNTFVEKIQGTISSVVGTADNVASASGELSSLSTQIADGTRDQMEKAAQVAAASEEMSATVMEVAQNASHASEAAEDASQAAQKGGRTVARTVEGMNQIATTIKESSAVITQLGGRSNEIGEIIKVIDEIADQTNLLALNAAIEAARAGEQGRGFAVVADEVRKLAERTTKATKEIEKMILAIQEETKKAVASMEASTQQVESEVRVAREAGDALEEIVASVERVTELVQQIAAASQEQSAASDQISRDIESVASVTQGTADGANQIAHSSQELSGLATELQEILARFRIGGENGFRPYSDPGEQDGRSMVQRKAVGSGQRRLAKISS
ncbi:MAG: methyl-accepting chemotaxis protein [Chloroflexi bacterium]|nr:methyl-accepting chemotaxis protein [Chloroflexota bacterium]